MILTRQTMRLYAVTDRKWTGKATLLEQVEAALSGGTTLVQLREKDMSGDDMLREAIEMRRLCHSYGVPLIINDRLNIALASGADGIHVGQSDISAGDVRKRAGSQLILGVSARTPEQARAAELAGADYLGCGAAFGTSTKADARPISPEQMRAVVDAVSIPVVAIGGVNADNLPQLRGMGLAGAAIVSGIFASDDIKAACMDLRALADEVFGDGNIA